MIEIEGVPELNSPVMIVSFEGWNDAADAASGLVDHLVEVWQARYVGAVDPDDYYDFQVNRPMLSTDEAGHDQIVWPGTRIAIASPPGQERDVILVRGLEPNLRWRQFCAELLGMADELGAELIVTLGAMLADTPHTRPLPVTGFLSEPDLRDRLDLEESTYEGPTGIVGVLNHACMLMAVPYASVWATVPHYVGQPPCPKATLSLVGPLEELLGMSIPLNDLPDDAKAWERGVDELAAEEEEIGAYVRALEEARDTSDLPEASGESIAREFQRYLRRRSDGS